MIKTGYTLTAKDVMKLNQFKNSTAYGTYIKSIIDSPIYISMLKKHVKNVDIKPDIVRLQSDGRLPENASSDVLNKLFKDSISRMAINLVADTVLLKEIEDKNVDDVVSGLKEDSNCTYLLGLADDKYYREAEKLLEQGRIGRGDLAYRGLVAWMKRKGQLDGDTEEVVLSAEPEETLPVESKKPARKKVTDFDSLNIEL